MTNRLETILEDLERSAGELHRAWDLTGESWHDSKREQAASELFAPTFEISKQTLASLRAVTQQAQSATASLRLP